MKNLKDIVEVFGSIIKICIDAFSLISIAKNALTRLRRNKHQIAGPCSEETDRRARKATEKCFFGSERKQP